MPFLSEADRLDFEFWSFLSLSAGEHTHKLGTVAAAVTVLLHSHSTKRRRGEKRNSTPLIHFILSLQRLHIILYMRLSRHGHRPQLDWLAVANNREEAL